MIPTQQIIAATLRLPIERRRALLLPGAGYLVYTTADGSVRHVRLQDGPPATLNYHEAWLPVNDTAWLVAARPVGGLAIQVISDGDHTVGITEPNTMTTMDDGLRPGPAEAALRFWNVWDDA